MLHGRHNNHISWRERGEEEDKISTYWRLSFISALMMDSYRWDGSSNLKCNLSHQSGCIDRLPVLVISARPRALAGVQKLFPRSELLPLPVPSSQLGDLQEVCDTR